MVFFPTKSKLILNGRRTLCFLGVVICRYIVGNIFYLKYKERGRILYFDIFLKNAPGNNGFCYDLFDVSQ